MKALCFIAIFSGILFSCSKNDDTDSPSIQQNEDNLSGKWKLLHFTYNDSIYNIPEGTEDETGYYNYYHWRSAFRSGGI